MTVTMVPVGAMAADIENDIAESPVNLTEIVPQDPSALDEQPVSSETTLLEESEPAEDEPKAEMVAEVEGKQYETLEAAIEAAQDGDKVELLQDVTLNTIITISNKSITFDMNGKTITYGATVEDAGAFIFSENSNVVICGNGKVTFNDSYMADDANSTGRMFEAENNAVLTIENGTFFGGLTCVLADGDSRVYIKDGSFSACVNSDGRSWVLNRQDKSNSRFIVTGGIFENYDPSHSKTENPEENFCAEGYVTTSEENDGSTFYTVEAATAKTDSEYYATLAEAVQAVVSSKSKTGTVTLLKDAVGGGIGLFNAKDAINVNLTIDFGGFTYTCDDPAVGSVGTESQGFHLEKDNTVTLKNGTIKVSPDSKKTIMLIQNYCDLTLENLNLYGSDATQYMISSNYGDTVLKNVNMDGTNKKLVAIDLMHWLGTGYADQAPTMQIQNDADNTIKGSIDVYCWGTDAAECQDKPTLTICGGHYTVDPSAYLATGYAAAASNKDGYVYQVVEASKAPAEVVPEAPKVENKLPEDASQEDQQLADEISGALQGDDNKVSIEKDVMKAAAGTVASQNTVTTDQGKQALENGNISVSDSDTVTIVVQPYLDVTLTKATSGLQKDFTVDITPMYRTVATTDVNNIVVEGEKANAVVIGTPEELKISKTVTVTIPLPTDFVASGTDKLYVHHQKNGVQYVYEGEVVDNTLTFTNPHGFSLFTITSAAPQAQIGDVNYATLQDAVNMVENHQTITLLADGSATVSREVTFKISENGFRAEIAAGTGYKLTQNGDTYTITEKTTSSGGGASHPEAGSTSSSNRYEITKPSKVENGSIKISDSKAEKGDTVTITVTPDEGYELDKLAVYDKDGDKIDLKDKGDGKFTFEMPKGDVEIEVSFALIEDETVKANFADVAVDAWYADAVQYVYENGMMSGTSETTFSPDLTTTRGMIVTILYRLEGSPDLSNENLGYPYADVDANAYYADAVYWARQNGIVSGMSAEQFAPNNAITREQMAAILYRYAQFKGYDVSAKADLSVYTDAAQVSTYATDAMAWANGAQLIAGTSQATLTPAGNATRAQVATILMRFCENIAK
ncbi:S-layer homology domain-containing protein [Butyricicoccus pullicaecorum]|uniref:S-layer homology domain-containing protein n=1 Tax=Butyricicoccus pullicaecorum TaxID=501571 RepID=UPI00194E627C|nr:S-layer homology domain-containing protein [Butyricicoccus pullicaecorum]